jgi:hypothetical protein
MLATVVFLAACGDNRDVARAGRTDLTPSGAKSIQVDHAVPLDAVDVSMVVDDPAGVGALVRIAPAEYRIIFEAESRASQKCMQLAGFSKFPVEVYSPAESFDPSTRPVVAGYHLDSHANSTQTSDFDRWLADTPGAAEAWSGNEVSIGCLAGADSAIYGSPTGYFDGLREFAMAKNAWLNLVDATPAVAALNLEWSKCLTTEGETAKDPTEPWRRSWSGDVPSAGELQLRAADLKCRSDVSYSDRLAAILRPLFVAWLQENRQTILDTRRFLEASLSTAATIVGAP